jgi:hypothetical protein
MMEHSIHLHDIHLFQESGLSREIYNCTHLSTVYTGDPHQHSSNPRRREEEDCPDWGTHVLADTESNSYYLNRCIRRLSTAWALHWDPRI